MDPKSDAISGRDLPETTDVLIVGGGVIGICVAYELSQQGRDVVVIDRGAIGQGSSAGNAGHIVPSHVVPLPAPGVVMNTLNGMLHGRGPVTARVSLSPDYLRWIAQFIRHCTTDAVTKAAPTLHALGSLSSELMSQWVATEEIDCSYRSDGLLDVYSNTEAFEHAEHHASRMRELGASVEIFDSAGVHELEPALRDGAVGGVLMTDDANLHPGRFLSGMIQSLVSRGVKLVPDTDLTGFDTTDRSVSRLKTSNREIAANEVVIAAGSWSPALSRLLSERLPVQPGKGYSITFSRPQTGPNRPMLLGERHVAVSPMGDELRLAGWFELGKLNTVQSQKRTSQIEHAARSVLHLDEQLEVLDRWAGVRPITPDGLPIIGRSPRWKNVTYATGHAMLGLSLGPATGRLVSQLLSGRTLDIDIDRCSPMRFQ